MRQVEEFDPEEKVGNLYVPATDELEDLEPQYRRAPISRQQQRHQQKQAAKNLAKLTRRIS